MFNTMGNWQNTTYIEHGNAKTVAEVIVALLTDEGMRQVERPTPREPQRFDPMQYAAALENNCRGVAVFPGCTGWTIVKTAPLELLGERAASANRMRLIELAGRLGVGGFQVNLYDGSTLVLVEVERQGRYMLSGFRPGNARNPDPLIFNGEHLTKDRIEARFQLLSLQQFVEESIRYGYSGFSLDNDELITRLAETLGGDNAQWCDNCTCVDILLRHRPLPMRGGVELYFGWPARDRRAEWLP